MGDQRYKLTSQVCCLLVRREGVRSDGEQPQCLFLVRWRDEEGMELGNVSYELRRPGLQESKCGIYYLLKYVNVKN